MLTVVVVVDVVIVIMTMMVVMVVFVGGSGGCDSVDSSGSTYVGQMAIVRKCFLQYGRHPLTLPTFLNLAARTILGL